ncbi:hypothetical protein PCE1_001957 [Barthelona sp. PCE]
MRSLSIFNSTIQIPDDSFNFLNYCTANGFETVTFIHSESNYAIAALRTLVDRVVRKPIIPIPFKDFLHAGFPVLPNSLPLIVSDDNVIESTRLSLAKLNRSDAIVCHIGSEQSCLDQYTTYLFPTNFVDVSSPDYLLGHFIFQFVGLLHLLECNDLISFIISSYPQMIDLIKKRSLSFITELSTVINERQHLLIIARCQEESFAKMLEYVLNATTNVMCSAIGGGELKHGPLALIDEHMPVLVLASNSENHLQPKLSNMTHQLTARKGLIGIIHTDVNEDLGRNAWLTLKIPSINPILQPLLLIPVALQLIEFTHNE